MYSCSVLWKFFTSALVPAGTLDTLSALNAPRCPKASQGLTRSLWAEMVFPDAGGDCRGMLWLLGSVVIVPDLACLPVSNWE